MTQLHKRIIHMFRSYRAMISLGMVFFSVSSALSTSTYFYSQFKGKAEEAAHSQLTLLARNSASSLSHALEIEIANLWTLTRDSEIHLATRSVLFLDDATKRLSDFREASRLAAQVMLLDLQGHIIAAAPDRSWLLRSFRDIVPGSERLSLLDERMDEQGLLTEETRFVRMPDHRKLQAPVSEAASDASPETTRGIGYAVAVPVRGVAGLSGFIVSLVSFEALKKLAASNIPDNTGLQVDPPGPATLPLQNLSGAAQDQFSHEPESALTSVSSREEQTTPHIQSLAPVFQDQQPQKDALMVRASVFKSDLLSSARDELQKILVLNLLIALVIGAFSYFVSLFFVSPLKRLTSFISSVNEGLTSPSLPHLHFHELKYAAAVLAEQRQEIARQLTKQTDTIGELKETVSSMHRLSVWIRALASCRTYDEFVSTYTGALAHLEPHQSGLYSARPGHPGLHLIYPRHADDLPLSLASKEEVIDELPQLVWTPYASNEGTVLLMVGMAAAASVSGQQATDTSSMRHTRWESLHESLNQTARVALETLFLLEKIREEERVRAQLRNARIEAELMTLKNQMNPHFLFNSLNSIVYLVDEDPERCIQAIASLSNLYRRILQASTEVTTHLSEEFDIVRLYLEMEKMRFTDRLTYVIENDLEGEAVYVPSLMVQTLVENAVKHGISKSVKGGKVSVHAFRNNEGAATVCVQNTGAAFHAEDRENRKGIGLTNTRKRLQLLYGDRGGLAVETTEDDLTSITIRFSGERK